MIVKMTKEGIIRLLENEEMIEYSDIEMPYKEFLINIETPNIKKMSVITDSWDEIMKSIS